MGEENPTPLQTPSPRDNVLDRAETTEPGRAETTEPGRAETTGSDRAETTGPGRNDPTEPGRNAPTEPGRATDNAIDPSTGKRDPTKDIWHARYLAKAFSLTQTRIGQLTQEGVFVRVGPARYVVGEAIAAYLNLVRGKKGSDEATPGSVGAAKTDLLTARAAMARLELDLKTGAVAKVSEFEAVWSAAVERVRARLLAIPSKVAPLVAVEDEPSVCMSIVEELVVEALEELAFGNGKPAGHGGHGPRDGPVQAADKDDGLPVGGRAP